MFIGWSGSIRPGRPGRPGPARPGRIGHCRAGLGFRTALLHLTGAGREGGGGSCGRAGAGRSGPPGGRRRRRPARRATCRCAAARGGGARRGVRTCVRGRERPRRRAASTPGRMRIEGALRVRPGRGGALAGVGGGRGAPRREPRGGWCSARKR